MSKFWNDNNEINHILITDDTNGTKFDKDHQKTEIIKANDNSKLSFISYGLGSVDTIIDGGIVKVTGTTLYKTYNRTYCKLDITNYDDIYLQFNKLGEYNENPWGDLNIFSPERDPYITCGLIKVENYKPEEDKVKHLSYDKTGLIKEIENTTEFSVEFDVKDLTGEYYLVITNQETGDFKLNPKYDPNTELVARLIGLYTYSAPDLIQVVGRIYNRPPTVPKDFTVYVDTKSKAYNNTIEEKMKALVDNYLMPNDITNYSLVENIDARFSWKPSIDEDEEKTTVKLPAGLSKGDVNKDGKIDANDLELIIKHLDGSETITDVDALWAACVYEKEQVEPAAITTDVKDLLDAYLQNTKQIVLNNKITENSWQVDVEKNLYFYEIIDTTITKTTHLKLYNEELYNLQIFDSVICEDGKIKIYVKSCPTKELELIYKINNIAEHKLEPRLESITYKLYIKYDNCDSETYYIFPKGKDYLNMDFIEKTYNSYKTIYQENANVDKFLKLYYPKISSGYQLEEDGKAAAYLLMDSEEKQYEQDLQMFRRYIVKAELTAIDELGEESEPAVLTNKAILYPNNTPPTAPTNIKIEQLGQTLHFIASGATDTDINANNEKDKLRYFYEIRLNKNGDWVPISGTLKGRFSQGHEFSLGDLNKDGRIDILDEITEHEIVSNPTVFELNCGDINRDNKIDETDMNLLSQYVKEQNSEAFNAFIINTDPNEPSNWWISDNGKYYTGSAHTLQDTSKKGYSYYIYSKELYDLNTFVEGKIIYDEVRDRASVRCTFKAIPTCDYEYEWINDGKSEVKLFEKRIGNRETYRIVDSYINRYVDVRARATDRMNFSESSEIFSSIIYMDTLLGVRNMIAAGISFKTIWHESATPPEDKKIFWIDTDEDEGGLKHWVEASQSWEPVPVIWS